jgi:hypothetical protein
MPKGLFVLIVAGAIFGLVAAITSALILYSEWHKHRLEGHRARKVALMGGAAAFAICTVMMVAWAFIAQDLIH